MDYVRPRFLNLDIINMDTDQIKQESQVYQWETEVDFIIVLKGQIVLSMEPKVSLYFWEFYWRECTLEWLWEKYVRKANSNVGDDEHCNRKRERVASLTWPFDQTHILLYSLRGENHQKFFVIFPYFCEDRLQWPIK